MNANNIINALQAVSTEERRITHTRFFKTGIGEYGEGDVLLGVTVPQIRLIAKQHKEVNFDTLHELLTSKLHEVRLCALLIIIDNLRNKQCTTEYRDEAYTFYNKHLDHINNWDLVDLSAPDIVGNYLLLHNTQTWSALNTLFDNKSLWRRRIAIVATLSFIRNNEYNYTLTLAERALTDKRDLIQKAVGWMLRELGKRNETSLTDFLDKHHTTMPRTMLRYAIERLTKEQKQHYMSKQQP